MFQGSKHVPGDTHFRLARRRPARATSTARRTSTARTTSRRCRRTSSSSALWLESDRMGYLLDTVDQANLSNQQDVVRNERRQSVENQPYGIVEEALFHQLFPKAHPYYASVIGSHADIQAAKLEDVKNFFKLYYAPNNASLAIVGDIDKAATKAAGREVLRHAQAGPAGAEAGRRRRRPSRPNAAPWCRTAWSCRACTWRGSRSSVLQARRRRRRHRVDRPSAADGPAVSTRSSSTRSRSRRTSARRSIP